MLVYFVFILFFVVFSKYNFEKTIPERIVSTTLFFSVLLVLITEVLSLFHLLNLFFVSVAWLCFLVLLLVLLVKDVKGTIEVLKNLKRSFAFYFKSMKLHEKAFSLVISIGLIMLFIQGLLYPPNNWDSLTYHMSRIMYWIGNESVEHFPTHILRHLYQPPFAEYFILNVNLLNGNDYLSNSVQWFFLVVSIFSLWSILTFFNVSKFYKLLAAFLIITIPSVELQASNTKNDIVCGFFVLTVLFYSLKSYYEPSVKNFILLAFSIGLGMLTKGTAYVFLAPILLVFGMFTLIKLLKTKNYKIIVNGVFLILIVVIINSGHFSRNYKINHNILNIDEVEAKMYSNTDINATVFVSNFLKNVGLHLDNTAQIRYDNWIRGAHVKHNINIDSPDNNFLSIPYKGAKQFETHEDSIPNYIHFLLLLFFFLLLFFMGLINPKKNAKELVLVLVFLLQIVLFTSYLKWQPWHTRLHIPLFMMSVLLIVVTFKIVRWSKIIMFICVPFLISGFYFNCKYNNLRPFKTNTIYTKYIRIKDDRFKKYFPNQPQLFNEYSKVLDQIYSNNPNKVGLMLSDWEYPLFNYYYYEKIQLLAINVGNVTKKIPQNTSNIQAIISNHQKTDFIIFEGKKYTNQTPDNLYIWYFK